MRCYSFQNNDTMRIPLIVDKNEPKWNLIKEVCSLIESRRFHEEMEKARITPISRGESVMKVMMVALFFAEEISYIVSELEKRPALREFIGMTRVPSPLDVSRFLSRFTSEQFLCLTCGFLNSLCRKRSSQRMLIIDSTDIEVDLNWMKKKKEDFEDKPYKWAYSSSKGFYVGLKMTLVVEYPELWPVFFSIHRGGSCDAATFRSILEELKKRGIMRIGDIVITDKGYCSYENYRIAFSHYKVIPLIFPKDNMDINRILSQSFPAEVLSGSEQQERERRFFITLHKEFENLLYGWREYRLVRGSIEDVFKLLKAGFFGGKVHRYTENSCYRFVACSVLLTGILLNAGFNTGKGLQALSES